MTQSVQVKEKPLTKTITVGRNLCDIPIEQTTDFELSFESLEKFIINRVNKKGVEIPKGWKLSESDVNNFLMKYNNNTVYLNDHDIEVEELDYYDYDEPFELYDEDEKEIFQQFVWYMISNKTVIEDKKTNIMFQEFKRQGGI